MAETSVENGEKWELPKRFRITKEDRTAEMEDMLRQSDEMQGELRMLIASPFIAAVPSERQRARARIIVDEWLQLRINDLSEIGVEKTEEYAAALAELGFYKEAASISTSEDIVAEHEAIHRALELPDDEWCEHGRARAVAVKKVFSPSRNAEVELMRCGECGYLNAGRVPQFVADARSRRTEIRQRYGGLKPLEAKTRMEADGVLERR